MGRLRPILGVLLAAASLAGCPMGVPLPDVAEAPADPAEGEVGFDLVGPGGAALVVPVHVNGDGPHSFVLDTGATVTCVVPSLARRLELPEEPIAGFGAGIGGAGRVRMVRIDSLRVGPARAENVTACSLDLGELEQLGLDLSGLVGLNFLRAFHVSLDFQRNVLTLTDQRVQE